MFRTIIVSLFVLSSVTALTPLDALAACGEDNQPACQKKVRECFTDDYTGVPYCGFNYEYYCNHESLEIEGWWNKVCKQRKKGEGLSCCTQVDYTDQYGGSQTKVTEGYYATADLTKAWIIIPNKDNPAWCSKNSDYKNAVMTIKEWADYGVYNARLLINANFFDPSQNPYDHYCNNSLGLTVSNKEILSQPGQVHGHPTDSLIFFTPEEVKKRGINALISSDAYKYYGSAIQNAISGFWLLQNGAYVQQPSEITPDRKRPRTAVGLSKDGNTLFLIVVNPGYDDASRPGGTTLHGMADYLKTLGASDALTLDGSGSSQLYFNDRDTGKEYASKPSDAYCPMFYKIPCYRPVPAFLGIH